MIIVLKTFSELNSNGGWEALIFRLIEIGFHLKETLILRIKLERYLILEIKKLRAKVAFNQSFHILNYKLVKVDSLLNSIRKKGAAIFLEQRVHRATWSLAGVNTRHP